jgi:hypothetical protein
MMPIDIVNVLTAAAPIVASVASIANSKLPENIERKDTKPVNNISITINNFYVNKDQNAPNNTQQQILDALQTGSRYII